MKREIFIYKISDSSLVNDKTGEVKNYKVVDYLCKVNNEYEPLQCYVEATYAQVVEKYKLKMTVAEFEERVVNKMIKIYLKTINNEKCRSER